MYTIHVIVANLVRLSDTTKSNNDHVYTIFLQRGRRGGDAQHKEFRIDIVCDLTHKATGKLED